MMVEYLKYLRELTEILSLWLLLVIWLIAKERIREKRRKRRIREGQVSPHLKPDKLLLLILLTREEEGRREGAEVGEKGRQPDRDLQGAAELANWMKGTSRRQPIGTELFQKGPESMLI